MNISERWYAIQVKTTKERYVADSLEGRGGKAFCPTYRELRRWSDRWKEVDVPLFAGYLFARFDAAYTLPVLTIPGVTRIVGAGNLPIEVDDRELAAIRAVVDAGLPRVPVEFSGVGEEVVMSEGPLKGFKCLVVRIKNQQRLIVSVNLLRRSVMVDIPKEWAPARSSAPSAPEIYRRPAFAGSFRPAGEPALEMVRP